MFLKEPLHTTINNSREFVSYLFEFDDILVNHVTPFGSEQSNGRKEQHHVFIRSPLWVNGHDKSLMLFVQIDAQFRSLFQYLQAQFFSIFAGQLKETRVFLTASSVAYAVLEIYKL